MPSLPNLPASLPSRSSQSFNISHPFPYLPIPCHPHPFRSSIIPSLAIPYIISYSFPSLPFFLNPSYTFPFQPSGFPLFSFISSWEGMGNIGRLQSSNISNYFPYLPILGHHIPSDPLSSHPFPSFTSPLIPFRLLHTFIIPALIFPSVTIPFHPFHPSPSLPFFFPFQLFPTPFRDSFLQILSHPSPSLTLSNFFSILPVPFRDLYHFHSFPSLPFLPVPSLSSHPVPFRSRTSGSEGYEAHPGQVECVFCRRGRRRHDHLWPMATSIGINIGSQPY